MGGKVGRGDDRTKRDLELTLGIRDFDTGVIHSTRDRRRHCIDWHH